ncbi:hypothetical protein HA142_06095 [Prochlorococcus marinus str. XMU1401]|uniref:Uncharacterized protein n=1 Tax=Prochlorococcus marinus str. XMU1401 TaxID=2052594 RepID=A0A8I1X6F6_PROMR|nr:hypothetical protein [Prochlorococcus marinus]MBO8223080.1 hypothetical protein [Prochlorococcus marinus str. XMU1401]MBW3059623.1 hypothetical protein [Prochlorococcus marinus str. XMU1401E]
MQYSSRKNPCPVCGRNKDSDCRWNDEVMFCHVGTNFAPPSHLKVGEVLVVNGIEWALVKTDAGHSGRAHVFKPHRPLEKSFNYSPHIYKEQKDKKDELFRIAVGAFEDYLKVSKAALGCNFQQCTLEELREYKKLIERSVEEGKEIRQIMLDMQRNDKRYSDYIELIDQRHKEINNLKNEADNFCWAHLGEIE